MYNIVHFHGRKITESTKNKDIIIIQIYAFPRVIHNLRRNKQIVCIWKA